MLQSFEPWLAGDQSRAGLIPTDHGIEDLPCEEMLDALRKAVDAKGCMLSLHCDGGGPGSVLRVIGVVALDEAFASDSLSHATAIADRGPARNAVPIDRAWLSDVGRAARPVLSIVFKEARTRSKLVCSVAFDQDRVPDRKMIGAAVRRLSPMLDAYFGLWLRNRHDTRQNRDLKGALNAIDLGVVLVDQSGAPCFTNTTAQALLADGRFLRQRGAAIHAGDFRDTIRLQAALGGAIASNADEGGDGARRQQNSALLKLSAGPDQLIVAALPAEHPADEPGAVAAMLIMLKPDVETDKVAMPACKLFGLSTVETQLACHLVAGNSVAEASKAMRIRETTGRGYLKQIFAKTNVNRQAELVRVLLTSIVRARTRGEFQII